MTRDEMGWNRDVVTNANRLPIIHTHALAHTRSLILTFFQYSEVMEQCLNSPAHTSQAGKYIPTPHATPSHPIPSNDITPLFPAPAPIPPPPSFRLVSSRHVTRTRTAPAPIRPGMAWHGMAGQGRVCHRVRLPTCLPACLPTRRVRARTMRGPCGGLRGGTGAGAGRGKGWGLDWIGLVLVSKGCGM
jgi:hypothetical protein